MCRAGRAPVGGFVLAGGGSTRMGTDKALLSRNGQTLLERAAAEVAEAAGNVTIIGDPSRYARFGWPVAPDVSPGRGPLGGIVTALALAREEWSLVIACDMPGLDRGFLGQVIEAALAAADGCECVAAQGPNGPEPLCAAYRRAALGKLRGALDRNILKMMTVLDRLEVRYLAGDGGRFANINTPQDWLTHD